MSGSSIGAVAGGVIGAVLAPYTGGMSMMTAISLGMSIGGMVGGMLDTPKGPHTFGPRLHDLSQQTSTYGTFLPRVYGTVALMGNVLWVENNALREEATTETAGGKGGPSASQTTYKYYATFAVSLCEGLDPAIFGTGAEIRLLRVWLAGKLHYNAAVDDEDTIIETNDRKSRFAFYSGTDTQNPDPRMQADLGAANCPAYRGICYIVFYDLDVENYSNSIAGTQVKVELTTNWHYTYPIRRKTRVATVKGTAGIPRQLYLAAAGDYVYLSRPNTDTIYTYKSDAPGKLYLQHTLSGLGASPYNMVIRGDYLYASAQLSNRIITLNISNPASPVVASNLALSSSPYIIIVHNNTLFATFANSGQFQSFSLANPASPALLDSIAVDTGITDIVAYGNYLYSLDDAGTNELTVIDISNPDAMTLANKFAIGGGTEELVAAYGYIYAVSPAGDRFRIYDLADPLNPSFVRSIVCGDDPKIPVVRGNYLYVTCMGSAEVRVYRLDNPSNPQFVVSHATESHPYGLAASGPYFYTQSNNYDSGLTNYLEQFFFDGDILVADTLTLADIVKSECLRTNLLKAVDFNVTELTQVVRGYRVSSLGSVRGGIEPLQGLWPFDVIQDGYKIKFVARGKTIDAVISEDDLDARTGGGTPGVRISTSREMETQLPRKVSITYMDAVREYDYGSQYYERTNTESVNTTEMEIAVVMTADEAYSKAQMLQYLYWLERYDINFFLPPEYLKLQPADVIRFTNDGGRYQFRIKQINYHPDARLEIQAKYNYPAIYSPTQAGQNGSVPSATLSRSGNTVYELLDIPLLQDVFDMSGLPAAMTGSLSGWPGGGLYRSDDGGQTFALKQAFTKPGAVIGAATNAISAQNAALLDKASRLNVRLTSGSLSSVSELQMLNGSNAFAYGVHGRWEIIGAQNAVLQADGTYTLSDFVRGRFGTEQYMGNHAVDDIVVLLDNSRLKFMVLDRNLINLQRHYKGVTINKALSTAAAKAFTYTGVNLEPLSGVYPKASRNPVSGNVIIEWVRRGRLSPDWRDKVDVPVGETSEAYEVDIFADNTFAAVKRVLTSITPSVVYGAADQITDFGSISGGDAFYNSVSLLLHGNGANNSTVFTDSSKTPKTVTANGNARIITTQTDPFGASTGVAAFDGVGDFLSSPFNAGLDLIGADFTIEAFIRPTHPSNASGRRIIGFGGGTFAFNATTGIHLYLGLNPDSTFVMGWWQGSAGTGAGTTATVANNVWTHVAASVSGTTVYLAVNGNVIRHNGNTFSRPSSNPVLNIATIPGEAGATSTAFYGQMSEIRITKGIARYTANFAVPTAPFENTQAFNQVNVKIYQLSDVAGRGYPLQATLSL